MVRRKWLRRVAGFMTVFMLFPGGMGGPAQASAAPAPTSAATAPATAAPAPAPAPDAPAVPAVPGAAIEPVEGAIAARLAAERPGVSGEDARRIAAAIACEAGARGVDPWLVYAVIEVESEFDIHARGGSGERGLMQILPSTARGIQRLVAPGEPPVTPEDLERPEVNIRFGTAYLAEQFQRYDADEGLALTAYNAGRAAGGLSRYARHVLTHYARHVVAGSGLAATPALMPVHSAVG